MMGSRWIFQLAHCAATTFSIMVMMLPMLMSTFVRMSTQNIFQLTHCTAAAFPIVMMVFFMTMVVPTAQPSWVCA